MACKRVSTSIGGQSRNQLAALDITTGQATAWDAAFNNGAVFSLALNNNSLYVGGSYLDIGGQDRRYLAALDPLTGQVADWKNDANEAVYTLLLNDNTLFAAGRFNSLAKTASPYFGLAPLLP